MKKRTDDVTPLYGIFNDSFPPIYDGVALTVKNYAEWFMRRGEPACVVTPWNPFKVETDYEVVRYVSLPIWNRHPYRYGYPKLDPMIKRRLRHHPFSIVHSHSPFSAGRLAVYAKRYHGVPLIGTFHSKFRTDLEHSFRHLPSAVPVVMRRILDFFNACDHVWIPQAEVEETVREYGYRGELTVVENGIDYASIPADRLPEIKHESRRALGIADDEISLLFVGQHIWEKGTDVILEALSLISGKVKFKMNFVGTGYAFNAMQDEIDRCGLSDRVTMRGMVSDREQLGRYYAAADLFLFPSLYDNAPLVVREAAAFGVPSIIPEGSTASGVIRDGSNGYLCKRTARNYADVISYAASSRNEVAKAGMNALATLVRNWEDVVGEVSERYKSIIRNFR